MTCLAPVQLISAVVFLIVKMNGELTMLAMDLFVHSQLTIIVPNFAQSKKVKIGAARANGEDWTSFAPELVEFKMTEVKDAKTTKAAVVIQNSIAASRLETKSIHLISNVL